MVLNTTQVDTAVGTEQLEALKARRERYRAEAFRQMIGNAGIFAVFAITAYLGGGYLDRKYEMGRTAQLTLLVVAFVLSWVAVFIRYQRINKHMERIDKEIREAQAKRLAGVKPFTTIVGS